MNPLQKRSNPFATRVKPEEQENVQNNVQEEVEDDEYQEIIQVQPKKTAKKQVVEVQVDNNRDKYTSTMDRNVRRAIKILCAQRGILFASFVEDACREKLRKEGAL